MSEQTGVLPPGSHAMEEPAHNLWARAPTSPRLSTLVSTIAWKRPFWRFAAGLKDAEQWAVTRRECL